MIRSMAVVATKFALLLILLPLFACSGVKTYREKLPKNFQVKTKVVSVSSLKGTGAAFDVHRVNPKCELDYLGRVYLDDPVADVGLPTDELIYLDFIFASHGLFSNASVVRHETMVRVRSGYDYEAQVSYLKGIYNVVIREKQRGGSGRIIEKWPLESCRPR